VFGCRVLEDVIENSLLEKIFGNIVVLRIFDMLPVRMFENTVKVKNQPDATKYPVLLPQHVSVTNMSIIRSTSNK
jgi:hypothetical protein